MRLGQQGGEHQQVTGPPDPRGVLDGVPDRRGEVEGRLQAQQGRDELLGRLVLGGGGRHRVSRGVREPAPVEVEHQVPDGLVVVLPDEDRGGGRDLVGQAEAGERTDQVGRLDDVAAPHRLGEGGQGG
ncbi:hypothetical protein GCM10020229_11550 [Kitasatospora albolonga]|uniref:hypothetical protein n=1 Tax=Kitasatospora albolonga TaxID=68173 RepID=UPI0031E911F0